MPPSGPSDCCTRLLSTRRASASRAATCVRCRVGPGAPPLASASTPPSAPSTPGPATSAADFERPAAGEDGQAPEQRLRFGVQQVVAPGHGVAHRPLADRRVARRSLSRSGRRPLQAGQQLGGREDAHAGRRQLEGQREPVQPPGRSRPPPGRSPASAGSRCGPHGPAGRRAQPPGQRGAPRPGEGSPGRAWARGARRAGARGTPSRRVPAACGAETSRVSPGAHVEEVDQDRGRRVRLARNCRERAGAPAPASTSSRPPPAPRRPSRADRGPGRRPTPPGPGRAPLPGGRRRRRPESAAAPPGGPQRQTGLADATGAGEGEQPDVLAAQEVADGGDLALAPDQRAALDGQGVRPAARCASAPERAARSAP